MWRYVYGGKAKPFIHPLCTPAGHCLTLFEPHDHVWHHGLWFTFKFVNGENFWEEHEPFGIQRTALPPSIAHTRSVSDRPPISTGYVQTADRACFASGARSATSRSTTGRTRWTGRRP